MEKLDPLYRAVEQASAKSIGRLWLMMEAGDGVALCPWCASGDPDAHGFRFQEGTYKCECPCHKRNS